MTDVAVIGGGPAGASFATRLATLGAQVCVFDRGKRPRQHRGETLPSSVHALLDALGAELPMGTVARARPPRHVVLWGVPDPRLAHYEQGDPSAETSLYVWREAFDRWLLETAQSRGATVLREARVGRVETIEEGWRIWYRQDGVERSLTTKFLADASGIAGVNARRYRQLEPAYRTLALTGHWSTTEEDPMTVIETFPRGWAWSAPLRSPQRTDHPRHLRDVTVMVERHQNQNVNQLYLSSIESTESVRALLPGLARGQRPDGSIRGLEVTPYSSSAPASRNSILLGDAASLLDPLSAHGVHKALDSGLTGAAVVRTILERPDDWQDAVTFYERRESSIVRMTGERLHRLYNQETRWPDEEFWRKRQRARPAGSGRDVVPPRPVPPLRGDMRLCPSPDVELTETPVLAGDLIERRPALLRDGTAVRYLGAVALPDLFDRVVRSRSEGATVEQLARGSASDPASYRATFDALEWMFRSGFLEVDCDT